MDGTTPNPRKESELLEASAMELAALVKSRAISAVELTELHIARIERVNPLINAVVNERFTEALKEARLADATVQKGGADLPPLLGVPCTIKEFFAFAGMRQTGGMFRCKDQVPTVDAPVVRRLRDAGAIVLGNTNVPEGGLWLETHNPIYGRTNNPWDLTRTSGGSSGGEGAIVASGGSPFGIGSDIGGSIRIPSAFCGIVGHKPSGRLVPTTGQFPGPDGPASAYLCAGPMTRRAGDLMPILRIIAGPDAGDPYSKAMPLGEPRDVSIEGMTVIPLETNGRNYVSPIMRREVRRAAKALEERGAIVKELRFPRMKNALEIWATMLEAGSSVHYDQVIGGDRGIPASEFFLFAIGRSRHSFPPLLVSLFERILSRIPMNKKHFIAEGAALQLELEAAMGDGGVILHPTYSRPAPRHHHAWGTPFSPACTAIFNVLEFPVSVVPTGFDQRGIPLSVQIVSGRGRDHVTIAAALALEEHFGGWVMATP